MNDISPEDLERIRTIRRIFNGTVVLILEKQDTEEKDRALERKAIKQHINQQRSER